MSAAPILTPNGYSNSYAVANGGSTTSIYNTDPVAWAKKVGISTVAGGTALQMSTIKNITSDIAVKINALITQQKAKIIANPNIVTMDNSEALIKLTEQVINKVTTTTSSTGVTQTDVQLFDAGIVLDVLPQVSNDGYITMRIRPSLTVPGRTQVFAGNELTLIQTREVMIEKARVKSGETLALAGLIRERATTTESKLPIVGDIPFLGKLFRNITGSKEKTELIILLTPKVINDVATDDYNNAQPQIN
jgi:type IV pilus assembly protein PilQ